LNKLAVLVSQKRIGMKFLLYSLALCFCNNANAVLSGHNAKGDYGLMAGTQAGPGFYVPMMYFDYGFDTLRNNSGEALPTQGEITVKAVSPMALWVADKKILGGNYSLLVAPAMTSNALEAPLLGGSETSSWELGDLYIQPISLGWHLPQVDFIAGLGIFAPTGKYEFNGDENNGLGMWSYELFAGTTIYPDENKNWHMAASIFWETHGKKEGTDIRVGDLLTIEGGVGRSFLGGAASAGLAFYAQWKLTQDDFGSLASVGQNLLANPSKHRVFALGPELTIPIASSNKLYALVTMRYFREFDAHSTSEGETFLLTLTFPVPSVPLR